jgi:2-keto-4-pentenoate hydratase/2-oxohepta-3-ene-1,7-dioic acid hydratase in catechol pathway
MALMIIRYDVGQGPRWAVVTGRAPMRPDDLVEAQDLATEARTLGDLVAELDAGRASPSEPVTVPARAILSPVTSDATLICQGLNYRDHAAEAGHHQRKANLLFAKATSSLCGPYADVVRPTGVELLDYEAEIGVVLRRALGSGTVVDRSNIGSFVAGVVLCNDVSARDTMFGASFLQWYRGKSYRTFCPAGPVFYYLDQDDVADTIGQLDLALSREGEPRQAASSADLIYAPEEALTEIAGLQDLKRGDLLLTGTPGGVIARGTPRVIGMLSAHLVDDVRRRDEIRVALGAPAFLQPGETLSLTLRDARRGVHLGGQQSMIVEETAHVH